MEQVKIEEEFINSEQVMGMEENNNENVQSLGQLLKEAREKKDLSLSLISRHTKISLSNLEAIENEDIENLPNIAYLKGFVKAFAKIVEADEEKALKLLNELIDQPEPEVVIAQVATPNTNAPSMEPVDSTLKLKILGAVAVVAISAFVLINRNKNEEKTEVVKVEEKEVVVKPQVLTSRTPLKEEVKQATATTEAKEATPVKEVKKEAVVKATPVKPEKVVEKKEEKKEKKTEETEKKKYEFYSLPSPLYTIEEISKENFEEIVPENYRNSVVSGKSNVFIRAIDGDTWISYKSDDNAIKSFNLKQGRYTLIRGDKLRIRIGNVNVTKVFLDNKLLKIKSRTGVKSLAFPKEFAQTLKLPLFIYEDGKAIPSDEYIKEHGLD